MFRRRDQIPNHYGNVKAGTDVNKCIDERRFATPADVIHRDKIPFNQAFIFLSNSPESLSIYIAKCVESVAKEQVENYKIIEEVKADIANLTEESKKAANSKAKMPDNGNLITDLGKRRDERTRYVNVLKSRMQFLCNMYVQITVPLLTTYTNPEEHTTETENLIAFIEAHKEDLSKSTVYSVIRAISDDFLLLSVYHIFEDISDYCHLLFERNQLQDIYNQMSFLKPEERMKLFVKFPYNFQLSLLKSWLHGDLPDMKSIFPIICEIVFYPISAANTVILNLQSTLLNVLQRQLIGMHLNTSPYMQVYFQLITCLDDINKLTEYVHHPFFIKVIDKEMNHDYLIRWLTEDHRKKYAYAAHICAHLKDRHEQAISYALADSIPNTMNILTSVLKDQEDLRECWIRALKFQPMTVEERNQWNQLLEASTTSGVVSLDDIFPLMPEDMGVDSFQGTILRSIKDYQDDAYVSQMKIDQFIKRANEQRTIIATGPSMMVQLEALQTCAICKQSIYRDKFLVFPCLHTIHIKCLLSNMNLYWTATERLNIISLAARAMKNEKNTTRLAEAVSECCPICGELSCEVLNKDFLLKEEIEERQMWELP